SQIFPPGGREAPLAPLFMGSSLATAAFGFALGRRTRSMWSAVLFGFGGISVGVMTNAVYDSVVNHIDHNLFPIEIVISTVLIMPGLIGGVATAHSASQQKK